MIVTNLQIAIKDPRIPYLGLVAVKQTSNTQIHIHKLITTPAHALTVKNKRASLAYFQE